MFSVFKQENCLKTAASNNVFTARNNFSLSIVSCLTSIFPSTVTSFPLTTEDDTATTMFHCRSSLFRMMYGVCSCLFSYSLTKLKGLHGTVVELKFKITHRWDLSMNWISSGSSCVIFMDIREKQVNTNAHNCFQIKQKVFLLRPNYYYYS